MIYSGYVAQFSGGVFHCLQYSAEKWHFYCTLCPSFRPTKEAVLGQPDASVDSFAGISGNLLVAGDDRETQQKAFRVLNIVSADHSLLAEMFLGMLKCFGCDSQDLIYYF